VREEHEHTVSSGFGFGWNRIETDLDIDTDRYLIVVGSKLEGIESRFVPGTGFNRYWAAVHGFTSLRSKTGVRLGESMKQAPSRLAFEGEPIPHA